MAAGGLNWIPRSEKPGLYCSTACGRGCTMEEYQRAVTDADALAARLGPGWKTRVWENMGWHYEAVSADGAMAVSHSNIGTPYMAIFNKQWVAHGDTPEEVVFQAWVKARDEISRLDMVVRGFEASVIRRTT